MPTAQELPLNTNASASEMAETIFGEGVEVRSAQYLGDTRSSGIFSDGTSVMQGVAPSDTGVILSTGRASDITNSSGDVNRSSGTSTNTSGLNDQADFNAIAGYRTYDAAILEVGFIPDGNTLSMQVVFSSEEYLEYVGSGFNDTVGIWVNGEPADLVVGDGEVSIDNINTSSNPDLYVDNAADLFNTEMDGFTVTLSLKAPVIPDQINTLRIGIADAGDSAYDSNLMIAGNSVQCAVIAQDDTITVSQNQTGQLDLVSNDLSSAGGTLSITHINGQQVSAGQEITLSDGVQLLLNEDGTLTVVGDDAPGSAVFSYTVADDSGNSDVGYATVVTTAPCFVAGTAIDTLLGPCAVEKLAPGEMVLTRDHGFQPIKWVGMSLVAPTQHTCPVVLPKGALGAHGRVLVSPQHRVLITGARAELLFGAAECLASAVHLLGIAGIRRWHSARPVQYVHVMFETHQIIRANGFWSESFLPGPQTLGDFSAQAQASLSRAFPHIDTATGAGYGAAARLCLRGFETRALFQG